jgi:hypothetical protein
LLGDERVAVCRLDVAIASERLLERKRQTGEQARHNAWHRKVLQVDDEENGGWSGGGDACDQAGIDVLAIDEELSARPKP